MTVNRQTKWGCSVMLLLALAFSPKNLAYSASQDGQINREFFGFVFWTRDVRFWRDVLNLMDEDAVGFGLVGLGVGWEKIEPNPPRQGVHAYDWLALDPLIQVMIDSGRMLDFEVLSRNNWATVVPYRNMDEECCAMSPPKEDADSDVAGWGMTAYQAWGDFVFNLVERYDGDGVSDAPGITRPAIKYLQLGNEPEERPAISWLTAAHRNSTTGYSPSPTSLPKRRIQTS